MTVYTLTLTLTLPYRTELTAKPRHMSHDVSVLVAGTFLRYFTSACEHLIAPMTLQGHSVDYYATLTTGQARRWRPTTLDVTYDPTGTLIPVDRVSEWTTVHCTVKTYLKKTLAKEIASNTVEHYIYTPASEDGTSGCRGRDFSPPPRAAPASSPRPSLPPMSMTSFSFHSAAAL